MKTEVRMKKKVISSLIAMSILCGTSYTAMAAPTNEQQKAIQESRDKYAEIEKKINDLNNKIDAIGAQIQPIIGEIYNNDQKIAKIKGEIESTQIDVEKAKEDLANQQKVFGDRMRAIYKSGGQENYLGVILSSRSVGDFLTKVQAVGKIMSIDKQMVEEMVQKKKVLDTKVEELQKNNFELEHLNADNKKKLDELNAKKADEQKLVDELKVEQGKVKQDLSKNEKALIEYPISVINNDSSSISDLENAISMIKKVRSSIVSTDVDKEAQAAIDKAVKRISDLKAQAAAQAAAQVAAGSSRSSAPAPNRGGGGSTHVAPPNAGSASALINYAYGFIGLPYQWAATGPNAYDCSGFTSTVFAKFGHGIGRTTYDQINVGRPVSYSDLQAGDLIFCGGTASRPDHVGIYVGRGQMVHAPRTGDFIKVGGIFKFVAARRVL